MSTVERQHELEQNALAEGIVRLFDAVRPHLVTIIGGGLAIVAAFVSWMVISSTNAATEARSWEAYLGALATGETLAFNEVSQRYPGSTAALWSQLVLADMALTDGAVLAFQDRATSKERLESAADLYTAVLAEGPDGLLAERATFGLAKVRESLGQFEDAQAGYASVANDFPESPLAVVAQEHADALADEATKSFYDWFFAQDLTPLSGSGSGVPEESAEAAADADDPAAGLFDDGPLESTQAEAPGESPQSPTEAADAAESENAPAAEPAPIP